jgi:hypothetical protein
MQQYGSVYNDCIDLNSKGKLTQLVIPCFLVLIYLD